MPLYNIIENSDNYSKETGILWQFYRDESAIDAGGGITDFPVDNNKFALSKLGTKIPGRTFNDGTKHVIITVPLKHLSLENP